MGKIIIKNTSSLSDSEALMFASRCLLELANGNDKLDTIKAIVVSADQLHQFYIDELKTGTRRIFIQQNLPF